MLVLGWIWADSVTMATEIFVEFEGGGTVIHSLGVSSESGEVRFVYEYYSGSLFPTSSEFDRNPLYPANSLSELRRRILPVYPGIEFDTYRWGSGTDWELVIAHWVLFVIALPTWLGLMWWRWRVLKKHAETLADITKELGSDG